MNLLVGTLPIEAEFPLRIRNCSAEWSEPRISRKSRMKRRFLTQRRKQFLSAFAALRLGVRLCLPDVSSGEFPDSTDGCLEGPFRTREGFLQTVRGKEESAEGSSGSSDWELHTGERKFRTRERKFRSAG